MSEIITDGLDPTAAGVLGLMRCTELDTRATVVTFLK